MRKKQEESQKTLKPEIRKMIQDDIELCENAIQNPEKSNALFRYLKIKYMTIDKDFLVGFPNYVKTIDSNSVSEITLTKTKLELYLMLDEIPITYDGNAARKATISVQAKTIKNTNIGDNNNLTNTTSTSINPTLSFKK